MPVLALSIRIQGRPRAAHPSPGRAPGPAPSRSLPKGTFNPRPCEPPASILLRALLPNSLPPLSPLLGGTASEPFACQTSRPNAAAFRGNRKRVLKFGAAGKHILPGSNLLCPREGNRRATGGIPLALTGALGLDLAEAAAAAGCSPEVPAWGYRDGVGGPFPLHSLWDESPESV